MLVCSLRLVILDVSKLDAFFELHCFLELFLRQSNDTDLMCTHFNAFFSINTDSLWQLEILSLFHLECFTESMIK